MKKSFTARRLVLDAMLIAVYVLLGFWKIPIGNLLRVNLASFSVVVCAVAFGPVDGLIVGFLGEFLSQILGPYGLTPTTVLWAMPEAVRGLALGLMLLPLAGKSLHLGKMPWVSFAWYLFACTATGLIASLINTYALYVDSKMFGYYNDYMVFGVLLVRLGMAFLMSGAFGYVSLHIVHALQANKIIKEKKS